MTNRKTFLTGILALALLFMGAATGFGQDNSEELDQLKQRFIERHPDLSRLKSQGKLGETHQGLADVVKPQYASEKVDPGDRESVTIAVFLQEENRDRTRLYQLLAERNKTTPQVVAERDALRRFERADPNEFLKPAGSGWVTKREYEQQQKEK